MALRRVKKTYERESRESESGTVKDGYVEGLDAKGERGVRKRERERVQKSQEKKSSKKPKRERVVKEREETRVRSFVRSLSW